MSEPFKFSRSEAVCEQKCQKLWYYTYGVENGTPTKGYTPKRPNLAISLGTALHKGMEVLFKKGSNLDAAVEAAKRELTSEFKHELPVEAASAEGGAVAFLAEQWALLEALLRAWRIYFWDSFNNTYEVVEIEQEMEVLVREGVSLQGRCDLIVRERDTSLLYVPDWKCVKDARSWAYKWEYEVQTYSQTYLVERSLEEPVAGCIYWAFVKGDRRNGRQCSPLIYGFKKLLQDGLTWEYSYETERGKGWERFKVWEEPGFGMDPSSRLTYWLNWIPEEVVRSHFVQSQPVSVKPVLVQEWVNQASRDMQVVRELAAVKLPLTASRSDWNCSSCWAKEVCYNERLITDAVGEGVWLPRQDHHKQAEEEGKE